MRELLAICAISFAIILSSGCVQIGGKNFSDLKVVLEKYSLDGTLAPGTLQQIKSFENDLLSLQALAKQQKNRESQALVSMIGLRITLAEMQKELLNASQEARFIDYYDTSCSKDTSIKRTMDFFDAALAKAGLAQAMLTDFLQNYRDFNSAAGMDFEQAKKTISAFESAVQEQKNAYKIFCT